MELKDFKEDRSSYQLSQPLILESIDQLLQEEFTVERVEQESTLPDYEKFVKKQQEKCLLNWVCLLLGKTITENELPQYLVQIVDKIEPGLFNYLQLQTANDLKVAFSASVIINPKCFNVNCKDILNLKLKAFYKLLRPLMYTYFDRLSNETSLNDLVSWCKSLGMEINKFEQL